MAEVYVELLDEGVKVWHPVEAVHIEGDRYQLRRSIPDGEEWQFQPGSCVRCELKTFGGGEQRLTAIAAED